MPVTNKYDREHLANLNFYTKQIEALYQEAVAEAARIGASVKNYNPDKPLFEGAYKSAQNRIEKLMNQLAANVQTVIVDGVKNEWALSNHKNDELANSVFGKNVGKLSKAQERQYFNNNDKALDAFLKRKSEGLNLSDNVWRYTDQFKDEIELALDLGIRSGKSADQISRDLRQYLNNPDKLFRRVRNQYGNLVLSKNAQDYHPGQGVYRSSYKNARRLAGTETNIAYRTADHDRWQELDMVVGIEVRLSNNHTIKDSKGKSKKLEDMCDELAGKYPKDFKFTGWHPNCRCYAVPILKTNEEVIEDNKRILRGEKPLAPSKSQNYVGDKDLHQGFRDWVTNNSGRIEIARNRGTLPYFIKDNEDIVNRIIDETPKKSVWEIAEERHARRTPAKELELRRYWQDKVLKFTPEQLRNFDRLEEMLGITRGLVMTDEEADMKNANPLYGTSKGYKINCQTCVPTFMLRKWGFNVTATPNTTGSVNEYISAGRSNTLFLEKDGSPIKYETTKQWMTNLGYKRMTPKRYEQYFEEKTKEQGLYCLTLGWKNERCGHATILYRDASNNLYNIEPQTINKMSVYEDISELAMDGEAVPHGRRGIFRIDDKIFNVNGIAPGGILYVELFNVHRIKR